MNWFKTLKAQRQASCATAATVVVQNGKVLMLQRGMSAPWMPGKWNLPGGLLEPMESAEAAAQRECREEAGISVQNLRKLFTRNIDGCPVTFFAAEMPSSAAVTDGDGENQNHNWYSFNDALMLDCVPGVHDAIRRARSGLHGYEGQDFLTPTKYQNPSDPFSHNDWYERLYPSQSQSPVLK